MTSGSLGLKRKDLEELLHSGFGNTLKSVKGFGPKTLRDVNNKKFSLSQVR